jgi:hypothetical protein
MIPHGGKGEREKSWEWMTRQGGVEWEAYLEREMARAKIARMG